MSTLARLSTAVHGGSNFLVRSVVPLFMYGTRYPIEQAGRTSDAALDRDLYDYIRWEYNPADRPRIVAAARRAVSEGRGRHRGRFWSRVQKWLMQAPRPSGEAASAVSATNE